MTDFFTISNENILLRHSIDETPDKKKYKMHLHMDYELYYFISGEADFYVEGRKYPLHSGDILIINNNESHFIDITEGAAYESCTIRFKKDFIRLVDKNGSLLAPFENREAGKFNLLQRQLFENDTYMLLLNNMMSASPNRILQIETNIFPLLNEILTAFNNIDAKAPADNTLIQRIIKYINENLSEPISLNRICEQFFISKSQLCRIFRKTIGGSVWNYITVKRLMMARNIIENGGAPSKIFSECGFTDYSVFFRAYKKHFGCSPNQTLKSNIRV